jgi:protein SCO1
MPSRRRLLARLGGSALGLIVGPSTARTDPQVVSGHTFQTTFPNVTLTGHDGRSYRFYDDLIRGKVVGLNMMYAACSRTCAVATANLLQVQNLLGARVGRDIFMYSITLLPEQDTRAALNEYAKAHHVKPGWLFLTGTTANIETVRKKLGFYFLDPAADADRAQHTGIVRIGNERVNRWSMSPSLADPRRIAEALLSIEGKGIRLQA